LSARSKVNSALEAIASSSCHVMKYWYLRENGARSEQCSVSLFYRTGH